MINKRPDIAVFDFGFDGEKDGQDDLTTQYEYLLID